MPEPLQKTLLISKSKLLSWIMHLGQAQERGAGDACVWNISIANVIRRFFSTEKKFPSDQGSSTTSIHPHCSAASRLPLAVVPHSSRAPTPPPAPPPSQRSIVHEQQNHSVSQNLFSSRGLAGTNEHGSDACKLSLPIFQHAQTPGIWRRFASSRSEVTDSTELTWIGVRVHLGAHGCVQH